MSSKVDFIVNGDKTTNALGAVKDQPRSERTVTVIIHPRGADDSMFQAVAVNFKVWQIRKGVEATIPWFVYEALKNAVETHFVEARHANGDIYYEDRHNPRLTVEVRAQA